MRNIAKTALGTTTAAGLLLVGAGAAAAAGSTAEGAANGSPGVVSGNTIQVPVAVPVNLCGNTVNILISLVNPAFGNVCINS
ncbi:chaplin [Streptomyces sp. NPDC092296]|uniref:chaplin n=1 Tax=Streptomyces sp. NPDC092296 TaxID=3366012 RepID=UPI0037F95ECA